MQGRAFCKGAEACWHHVWLFTKVLYISWLLLKSPGVNFNGMMKNDTEAENALIFEDGMS